MNRLLGQELTKVLHPHLIPLFHQSDPGAISTLAQKCSKANLLRTALVFPWARESCHYITVYGHVRLSFSSNASSDASGNANGNAGVKCYWQKKKNAIDNGELQQGFANRSLGIIKVDRIQSVVSRFKYKEKKKPPQE